MCWQDVRIARSTTSVTRNVSLTAAAGALLSANPNRIAIIVGQATTNAVLLYTDSANPVTQGYRQNTNSIPIVMHIRDYGTQIQNAWFANGAGGVATLTVTEVLLTRNEKDVVNV